MVLKGISSIESSIRQLEKQEASWRLVIFGLVSENSLLDFIVFGQSWSSQGGTLFWGMAETLNRGLDYWQTIRMGLVLVQAVMGIGSVVASTRTTWGSTVVVALAWRLFVMYSIYIHILLIHFITTRTFAIETLYHSTYFLNISFKYRILPFKNPKTPFLFTLLYLLHFCYIRVKGQCSQTCRVECSNLYSNTFLKWQVRLRRFRRLKTALNHYINFGLSSTSCYIPMNWNIVIMILTDILPVYL